MHRKTVAMLALFAVFAVISKVALGRSGLGATDVEAAIAAPPQEQVLASIIQIEMRGESRVEGGLKHTPTSRGLGTLVQSGGQRFVITHNHWSLLPQGLDRVELRNAANEPLLVLDREAFLSLVRYQDWGTLLLEAPPQLRGVIPAALGDSATLVAGDTVWLASQAAGGENPMGLATAWVNNVDATSTPGLIELRGSDSTVVAGDSGGGIWHDGRLVGNLWAITVAPAQWPWQEWFGGAERPTGAILAVMQPLGGTTELIASDLAPEPAENLAYDRGPQR